MKRFLILLFVITITLCINSLAQTQSSSQYSPMELPTTEIFNQAIQLINDGKYIRAIELLDSAQEIDPVNIIYPYEKALALSYKTDYKAAISILDSLLSHPQVNDQVYQLLGNIHFATGDDAKSHQTYLDGLKKFPSSGRLYMELGIYDYNKKDRRSGLALWEKGISFEPGFPDNYYLATNYYFKSGDIMLGILYGEIFINISNSQEKRKYMSRLLYEAYNKALFRKLDSVNTAIKFSSLSIKTGAEKKNRDLPFGIACQNIYVDAAKEILPKGIDSVNINQINLLRKKFIELWYKEKLDATFPNIVFDWQKKLIENGQFIAYDYLLFNEGNQEEFKNWYTSNHETLDKFFNWIAANELVINKEHFFTTSQYH